MKTLTPFFWLPFFCLLITALHAADAPTDLLGTRGLPRFLYNNDSDDLKWSGYPQHHAALWVPAGEALPLHGVGSPEDYLARRIAPLAKTSVTGLSYCGNFGVPVWELPQERFASLGDDPLKPIAAFWKEDGRTIFFSVRMNDKHHAYFNWAHLWDDFRRTHRHWFLKPPSDAEWKNEFLPWLNDPTKPGPKDMWAKVKTQPEALRAGPNREANGEKLLGLVPFTLSSDPAYLFAKSQLLRRADKPQEAARALLAGASRATSLRRASSIAVEARCTKA
jgi:hypothetical protein